MLKSYVAQMTPEPLPEPIIVDRRCRSPLPPMFLTFGMSGLRFMCEGCRAWQVRLIRNALPATKGLV